MSEWNGFGGLDLSSVDSDSGPARLQPGTYEVECTGAEIKDTSTGGKMIVAEFKSTNGEGVIRSNFNVVNANPQAVEIGLRQLKSFLVSGGHPNPDKPKDINTLKGLKCKLNVGMGKPWRNSEGVEVQSSEVKSFMPSEVSGGDKPQDDEIPF